MSSRPDRATVLRWIFLVIGLFLLFGGGAILGFHTVVRQFAIVFLGDDGHQPIFAGFAVLFPLVASGFCLITARGIQTGRSWSRLACSPVEGGRAGALPRDGVRWRLQLRVQVKALPDRLDRFRGGRETGEDVE